MRVGEDPRLYPLDRFRCRSLGRACARARPPTKETTRKCLVIGAGAQGAAAASILSRAQDVESFLLADRDTAQAEAVKAHIAGTGGDGR